MPAKLHLAEYPLALHLLFQRLEGLVDIVIPNENLHEASSYDLRWGWGSAAAISPRLLPDYGRLAESSFGVQRLNRAAARNLRRYCRITPSPFQGTTRGSGIPCDDYPPTPCAFRALPISPRIAGSSMVAGMVHGS